MQRRGLKKKPQYKNCMSKITKILKNKVKTKGPLISTFPWITDPIHAHKISRKKNKTWDLVKMSNSYTCNLTFTTRTHKQPQLKQFTTHCFDWILKPIYIFKELREISVWASLQKMTLYSSKDKVYSKCSSRLAWVKNGIVPKTERN